MQLPPRVYRKRGASRLSEMQKAHFAAQSCHAYCAAICSGNTSKTSTLASYKCFLAALSTVPYRVYGPVSAWRDHALPVVRRETPLEQERSRPEDVHRLVSSHLSCNLSRASLFSWLFLAFLTAGIICMICAFAIKGKDIGMDDPIAWVMFIFYTVAIVTMLGNWRKRVFLTFSFSRPCDRCKDESRQGRGVHAQRLTFNSKASQNDTFYFIQFTSSSSFSASRKRISLVSQTSQLFNPKTTITKKRSRRLLWAY